MDVQEKINNFINSLPEPKGTDMETLHQLTLQQLQGCKLSFEDGKKIENKTVSNPNIGYGFQKMKYANGTTREIFQMGLSPNQTGISVYILGIKFKSYLEQVKIADTIESDIWLHTAMLIFFFNSNTVIETL
jgi:hypothetical protein